MNILTREGNEDNVQVFEHYCDTKNDLLNIPKDKINLGSTAIVLKGDSGELEVYMATSDKEWMPLLVGGGGSSSSVEVEELTVTENGIYIAPEGIAYSPITVDISSGSNLDVNWLQIVNKTDISNEIEYTSYHDEYDIAYTFSSSPLFNEDTSYENAKEILRNILAVKFEIGEYKYLFTAQGDYEEFPMVYQDFFLYSPPIQLDIGMISYEFNKTTDIYNNNVIRLRISGDAPITSYFEDGETLTNASISVLQYNKEAH